MSDWKHLEHRPRVWGVGKRRTPRRHEERYSHRRYLCHHTRTYRQLPPLSTILKNPSSLTQGALRHIVDHMHEQRHRYMARVQLTTGVHHVRSRPEA